MKNFFKAIGMAIKAHTSDIVEENNPTPSKGIQNHPDSISPLQDDYRFYSSTSRIYEFTPAEAAFFDALDTALTAAHKSRAYKATRMSNGALSVSSQRAYLGKIKLQGRKTWMQYMTGIYSHDIAEDKPLEEYIRLIEYWVKIA